MNFDSYMLPGVPAALFWTLVSVAVLLQGISKSGFAGGLGILSVPLMLLVMPADRVVAALLPILILCDFNAIYFHRSNCDWPQLRRIYLPAIIGIVLGAAVWWYIGQAGVHQYEVPLKRFVGCIAVLFAGYIFAKETSMQWAAQHKAGPRAAWAAGISAGFTSTLAHAAGPIVSLYMFSQGLGKTRFVGTVAWTFTAINLTKLPFYLAVGMIDWRVLTFDAVLLPLIPLGSFLGLWMHDRVPERPFNWLVLALTLVAGVQLVFNVPVVQLALQALAGGG
ncbi:MAG: TSUP family transporter [Candidatus Hydrogenedens sp.]|nr:TSUP family transporter [Candidatus Hydrogenedens sp.]